MDVRRQAMKNKRLQERCIEYVRVHHHGAPVLACKVADAVRVEVILDGLFTTAEVLMKEMRAAARAGRLRKSYTTTNGTRLVQYSPVEVVSESHGAQCAHPRADAASPGSNTSNNADCHEQHYDADGQGLLLERDAIDRPYWKRD